MLSTLHYLSIISHTPLRPCHPLLLLLAPSIRPYFFPLLKLVTLHVDSPSLLALLIHLDPFLLALLPTSKKPIYTIATLIGLTIYTSQVTSLPHLLHVYTFELDLTPNPGLWWYLITEMFQQWRAFFVCVLVLNLGLYVGPIHVRLRNDPATAKFLTLVLLTILHPYPTYTDAVIYLTLLPIYLTRYMKLSILTTNLYLFTPILSTVFKYTWLSGGGGNANFYFAGCLLWATSQGILWKDTFEAWSLANEVGPQCPYAIEQAYDYADEILTVEAELESEPVLQNSVVGS